ncbi:MAG: hypothetical protein ACK524_11930, partial [Planctomyces sp.]
LFTERCNRLDFNFSFNPCSDLPAYWISFSLDSLDFFFHPEVHAYREFFFQTHFFPDNPEVPARWMGILRTHLSFHYTGEPARRFFFPF